MITNIILTAVILLIAGCAGYYIYRAKKSGATCIGCPHSKQCGGHCCDCNSDKHK